MDKTPLYRVTVVARKTQAVNYRYRSGQTKVDFRGTALMPQAVGNAEVKSLSGYIEIEAEMNKIGAASQFGPEYLTFVLWAISPEGRANNLGEVILDGDRAKLKVSTELQSFGLIVTAEPYFAVTQPSDVVVMENVIRQDTKGKYDVIDANFELLQRGQYVFNVDRSNVRPMDTQGGKVPLQLLEARNAVQIARWTGAEKYAPDVFNKAQDSLKRSEDYHARKQTKPTAMVAREAVQTSEDARIITLRRQEEERLQNERLASSEREKKSRDAAAEASRLRLKAEEEQKSEAARRAQAEAEQKVAESRSLQAESDRAAAEKAKAEALIAQQAAMKAQQEAEAARQALSVEADKARLAAEQSRLTADQAIADKERLRQQLLTQLNTILETRDSARGLIVNMSDVLFDTGQFTLRPAAREKLARISGILASHPSLRMEVEGHTDSVGGEAFNQRLSERRADSVKEYLVTAGISTASIVARGFGKTMPIATNDSAAGRQQNRRVELVVSGEAIGGNVSQMQGVQPGTTVPASPAPQP